MALRADALSAMMACMVTFIATFIAIYASGYMAGDPGYPRFFAAVSGFVAAMTILVLGRQLLRAVCRLGRRRACAATC